MIYKNMVTVGSDLNEVISFIHILPIYIYEIDHRQCA